MRYDMALWLCRAGRLGEFETKFIEDNKIYCTWDILDWDMSAYSHRDDFKQKVQATYSDVKPNTVRNWVGQLWAFSHEMKSDDWVLLPSKIKSVVYIGIIRGHYKYNGNADTPFWHSHDVKWIKEISRSEFDQDLLYSIGAFLTICKIQRNNAEDRISAMIEDQQIVQVCQPQAVSSEDVDVLISSDDIDLEGEALQEIADQIIRKYKGHGLAKIIAAILEAKGFTTYVSPAGPDRGVDILASQGSLGFDPPRICVQVKSSSDPVDRQTHDQLVGAMSNHKADYGLLVSWGGFKNSITSDTASHFFKVRLWTHKEIVQEFLRHYKDLPEDIQEIIPLKQIWIIDKRSE